MAGTSCLHLIEGDHLCPLCPRGKPFVPLWELNCVLCVFVGIKPCPLCRCGNNRCVFAGMKPCPLLRCVFVGIKPCPSLRCVFVGNDYRALAGNHPSEHSMSPQPNHHPPIRQPRQQIFGIPEMHRIKTRPYRRLHIFRTVININRLCGI